MTQQHYHHIFTPTNTAHILHQNDRKTTFRKLIFHSGSVSPAAATLKESSAYLCVGHDRKTKTLQRCCSFTVARAHKYTLVPIPQACSSSVLSSLGHQGGAVVKPYGPPLLGKLGGFDVRPQEHTQLHAVAQL